MPLRELLNAWPVVRQFRDDDPLARGAAAQSQRSATLRPRTADADKGGRVGRPPACAGLTAPAGR